MKILLTGASSFTGSWFARALAGAGHSVVATFTRPSIDDYDDPLRASRVHRVAEVAEPRWNCKFGDALFVETLRSSSFDLLCHHAADVTDYKSDDFDFARALQTNTDNLRGVLDALEESGRGRVVLTGSVFEGGEGAGSEQLPHVSAYGLSKSLTSAVFEHFCQDQKLPLGKFVIPNPFGPFEEPRFTNYLIRTWRSGETAAVRTPDYVRDNIHVGLLSACYNGFCEFVAGDLPAGAPLSKYSPAGYIETQGAFAQRFAREMAPRLDIACPLELSHQTEFVEPRIRINTDPTDRFAPDWDENLAWDELADYYRQT